MILIIGGAYQGKTTYAKTHFGDEAQIVDRYHLRVREQLEAGLDPLVEVRRLLKDAEAKGNVDQMVIISDELGYGLVPIDPFERAYREASGRVNCYLAEHAERVIRVVCGISTLIK